MMTAAKKQKEKRFAAPRHFENWREFFAQDLALRESHPHANCEVDRGKIIAEMIANSVRIIFLPGLCDLDGKIPHIETKVNVLHALIEISTAVAYTPKGQVSDSVRHGSLPHFLINKMYDIVKKLTSAEVKRVGSEGAFL